MAWNEPGGNGSKKQDPWGKRSAPPKAPDLKAWWQDLQKKWRQFRNTQPSGGKTPWGQLGKYAAQYGHYIVPAVLLLAWLIAGITYVGAGEEAVVLQTGKYSKTLGPGTHWLPPFSDKAYIIPRQQINTINLSGNIITEDQQVLVLALNVQYRIADPKTYLFAMADARQNLEDNIAMVANKLAAHQTVNTLLNHSHQDLNIQFATELNQGISAQLNGLMVTDVSVQSLSVPSTVAPARAEVLKAQQISQQAEKQAQTAAAQIIAQAHIKAERLQTDAKAYQQKVVIKAQGNTARYLALLPEYQHNPQAMRNRLYVETMQSVLSKMTKVFIDLPASSAVQVTLPALPVASNNSNKAVMTGDKSAMANANETDRDNATLAYPSIDNAVPGYGNTANSY